MPREAIPNNDAGIRKGVLRRISRGFRLVIFPVQSGAKSGDVHAQSMIDLNTGPMVKAARCSYGSIDTLVKPISRVKDPSHL